jgi:curved DNA-binding protein CbpA
MLLKDYYNILQIPPHATLPEIKQAYRRLAMIYHPDKNRNDPYSNAQFSEIKEAYEVLTNPVKKETWLQERWYNQSIGKKRAGEAITPVSILKLSLELEKYVSLLDVHRMNKGGLARHIGELLSADTIDKLKEFDETGLNRQIISTILTAMKSLPLKFIKPLSGALVTLANNDEIALQRINHFLIQQKKIFLWEKYKGLVIILLTLLICLLIYVTTK